MCSSFKVFEESGGFFDSIALFQKFKKKNARDTEPFPIEGI
jgi:hypothetical protein